VINKPGTLLCDPECPVHLIAADAVLAIRNHPNCREPLAQVDRAILKNRSDLGRELAARMLLFAFPHAPCRDEPSISPPARGAMHAARPAERDHRSQRNVRVGEIPDGFDKSFWLRERGFGLHATEGRAFRSLSQVYYHPKKVFVIVQITMPIGTLIGPELEADSIQKKFRSCIEHDSSDVSGFNK
jgi:hypothetical protein